MSAKHGSSFIENWDVLAYSVVIRSINFVKPRVDADGILILSTSATEMNRWKMDNTQAHHALRGTDSPHWMTAVSLSQQGILLGHDIFYGMKKVNKW